MLESQPPLRGFGRICNLEPITALPLSWSLCSDAWYSPFPPSIAAPFKPHIQLNKALEDSGMVLFYSPFLKSHLHSLRKCVRTFLTCMSLEMTCLLTLAPFPSPSLSRSWNLKVSVSRQWSELHHHQLTFPVHMKNDSCRAPLWNQETLMPAGVFCTILAIPQRTPCRVLHLVSQAWHQEALWHKRQNNGVLLRKFGFAANSDSFME